MITPPRTTDRTPDAPGLPAWSAMQGLRLQSLRESAGVDEAVFAKNHAISLAQLRTLEGRGHAPFYSEAIKRRLGQRLLESLGHRATEQAIAPAAVLAPPPGSELASAATAATPAAYRRAAPSAPLFAAPDAPAAKATEAAPRATERWPRPRPAGLTAWRGSLTRGRLASPRAGRVAGGLLLALGLGWMLWPTSAPGTDMLAIQAIALETVPNAAAPALASEGQADTVLAHTSAPRSELTAHVCSESQRNQAAAFTPERPLKPASYVHVEAAQQTWLCLVDARGQVVEIELRPGEARSFSGTPPFLVQSPNPQALRLFFQGLRVPGALVGPNGVLLQAVPST